MNSKYAYFRILVSAYVRWLISFSGQKSIYSFTKRDISLYLKERRAARKVAHIEACETRPDFLTVEVDGLKVHWPKDLTFSGLPWMFGEVFAPFEINPSSYSHPTILNFKLDWVIDGGACEGYFISKSLADWSGKVFAFEPFSRIGNALEITFKDELNSGRLEIFQELLSDTDSPLKFIEDLKSPWDSRVNLDSLDETFYSPKITTIDKFVAGREVMGNGLIKLDVEGMEMKVLAGATETLKLFGPSLSIAVYHNYENAKKCKEIILQANPNYQIEFRGFYGWASKPRPYMLYAWLPKPL